MSEKRALFLDGPAAGRVLQFKLSEREFVIPVRGAEEHSVAIRLPPREIEEITLRRNHPDYPTRTAMYQRRTTEFPFFDIFSVDPVMDISVATRLAELAIEQMMADSVEKYKKQYDETTTFLTKRYNELFARMNFIVHNHRLLDREIADENTEV